MCNISWAILFPMVRKGIFLWNLDTFPLSSFQYRIVVHKRWIFGCTVPFFIEKNMTGKAILRVCERCSGTWPRVVHRAGEVFLWGPCFSISNRASQGVETGMMAGLPYVVRHCGMAIQCGSVIRYLADCGHNVMTQYNTFVILGDFDAFLFGIKLDYIGC